MMTGFITIKWLDVIDIVLVAFLMYQLYMLIRGTVAINIFIGIFTIYLIWHIVKALNMQLLSSILGQIIGVGVIALIIVFQQEIRRFLLLMGTRYMSKQFSIENIFAVGGSSAPKVKTKDIVRACIHMAKSKTGALIVIGRKSALHFYAETGEIINANCSSRLMESIFFKNSPMHDGAIIIIGDKIFAAGCILPITQSLDVSENLGMRHRAALGMCENNDSLVIVISEENSNISFAEYGKIKTNISLKELNKKLEQEFAHFDPVN
jgi:uncharacterized protein (TIGR00159 family)